jgi:hypothetical protein
MGKLIATGQFLLLCLGKALAKKKHRPSAEIFLPNLFAG